MNHQELKYGSRHGASKVKMESKSMILDGQTPSVICKQLDGQSSFSSLQAINPSLDYFTALWKLPNSSLAGVYLVKWEDKKQLQTFQSNSKKLTSQHPRGSPLAASNPADIMVKSGANSVAEIMWFKHHWRFLAYRHALVMRNKMTANQTLEQRQDVKQSMARYDKASFTKA